MIIVLCLLEPVVQQTCSVSGRTFYQDPEGERWMRNGATLRATADLAGEGVHDLMHGAENVSRQAEKPIRTSSHPIGDNFRPRCPVSTFQKTWM